LTFERYIAVEKLQRMLFRRQHGEKIFARSKQCEFSSFFGGRTCGPPVPLRGPDEKRILIYPTSFSNAVKHLAEPKQ